MKVKYYGDTIEKDLVKNIEKLKELGICEGDTVKISDWELEWYE